MVREVDLLLEEWNKIFKTDIMIFQELNLKRKIKALASSFRNNRMA